MVLRGSSRGAVMTTLATEIALVGHDIAINLIATGSPSAGAWP
jgi:hypothetical protein